MLVSPKNGVFLPFQFYEAVFEVLLLVDFSCLVKFSDELIGTWTLGWEIFINTSNLSLAIDLFKLFILFRTEVGRSYTSEFLFLLRFFSI